MCAWDNLHDLLLRNLCLLHPVYWQRIFILVVYIFFNKVLGEKKAIHSLPLDTYHSTRGLTSIFTQKYAYSPISPLDGSDPWQ